MHPRLSPKRTANLCQLLELSRHLPRQPVIFPAQEKDSNMDIIMNIIARWTL